MEPLSGFIGDEVYLTLIRYTKLQNQSKLILFKNLLEENRLEEFKEEISKIWDNIDHSYMEETIEKLNMMVDEKNNINEYIPQTKQYEELVPLKEFTNQEQIYKKNIENIYKQKIKTINKGFVNKEEYLEKLVQDFNKAEATVPYRNKDGAIRCYQTVGTYNSMLYNYNLNRSGWNRTMQDAEYLGNDLVYLPAHPFACPMCMEYQGKVYSISGKSKKYPAQEEAIKGGVGHPNCKHQWLIYWGPEQLQKDKYNSAEWQEKYENKQKVQSLELARSRLKTDREIYKNLNAQNSVDKVNAKIKSINTKIRELK